MDQVLQLSAVAVTGALCVLTLRKQIPELALVLAVVTGLLLLSVAFDALEQVKAFFSELSELAGLAPEILAPLVKTVGIAILTRVTAELCRDVGEGGIAAFAEVAGGAAALCVALPLAQAVLVMISGLL
jgi:stage III sporulation protein AD